MQRITLLLCTLLFISLTTAQGQPLKKMQQSQNFYDIKAYYETLFKDFEHSKQPVSSSGEPEVEDQDNAWKIFKRWENFYEPRVYPSGEMNYEKNIFREYQKIKKSGSNTRDDQTNENWTLMGPDVVPQFGGIGRLDNMAFDPNNPDIMWVGSPSGGLWKSTDGAGSWSTNTDLLPVLGVSEITIDPTNTNVMYIATGDRDAGDTHSLGIFKSTDGGLTWNPTGLNYTIYDNFSVRRILMLPQQTNTLITATNFGIYKTDDGGLTWTQMQAGDFWDLEFKPDGNNSTIYACDGLNFYISNDEGNTWTQSSSGLPTSGTGRMNIGVSAGNPAYVYLLLTDNYYWGFQGLYRSTDGGATWTEMSNSPNLLGWDVYGGDTGGQGWYTLALAVDPENENVLYVGGVDIWKSIDGGSTWTIVAHWYGANGTPYVHADIHDLVAVGNNTVYSLCDGGIFKTPNGGNNWYDLSNGMAITQYYRFSNAATDSGFILAGAQDNGTSRLSNGAWEEVHGGDGMEALVDFTSSNIVYAESQGGYLDHSFDGGNTWSGITPGNGGAWVTPFIIDPNSHAHLIYGGTEIYQTNNYGNSWTQSTSGQTNGNYYQSLAIAPSNSTVIYAATSSQLLKTTDGGNTWSDITGHLPASLPSMTYIAVKSTDENTLWITCSGFSAGKKVYQSTDGGMSWQNVSDGIPNLPVNCIVYKNGPDDEIYIGTDIGVYYKENYLSNWIQVNNGLPNVIVDELEIQYDAEKLRAATFGRGIWQTNFVDPVYYSVDATVVSIDIPSGFICTTSVNPQVTIKNYGITPLTSVDINYHIDNGVSNTYNFVGNIPSLGTQTVLLPSITVDPGTHVFYASTNSPNGLTDEFTANDGDSAIYTSVVDGTVPVEEDFESNPFPPSGWQLENSDNWYTWHKTNVGAFGSSDSSMMMDLYFYYSIGQLDNLVSPRLDFSAFGSTIKLTFDVADARYSSDYNDSLFVLISNDCAASWTRVYSKGGETLATTPDVTYPFIPASGDWRHEEVNLGTYSGEQVLVMFQCKNGYGNNLYIDNININDEPLSFASIDNDKGIYCFPNPSSDKVMVQLKGMENFSGILALENTMGEIVWQKTIGGGNKAYESIDVSELPAGIYTILVKSTEQAWTSKLIIAR